MQTLLEPQFRSHQSHLLDAVKSKGKVEDIIGRKKSNKKNKNETCLKHDSNDSIMTERQLLNQQEHQV